MQNVLVTIKNVFFSNYDVNFFIALTTCQPRRRPCDPWWERWPGVNGINIRKTILRLVAVVVVDWSVSNRFLLIVILAHALKDDVEYFHRLGK